MGSSYERKDIKGSKSLWYFFKNFNILNSSIGRVSLCFPSSTLVLKSLSCSSPSHWSSLVPLIFLNLTNFSFLIFSASYFVVKSATSFFVFGHNFCLKINYLIIIIIIIICRGFESKRNKICNILYLEKTDMSIKYHLWCIWILLILLKLKTYY